MKILLFVLALWAFMSIAPSDGKDVRRHYGPKGTICKRGRHWIVKIKCTDKCIIHKPKAAFEKGGKVRITGRVGTAFRQKKKLCGRNCFCTKTSKPRWNQVFCQNHRGKKITSDRVHFDIWCIKRTNKLRFRAYVKNIKQKMMIKPCPTGQNRHEDGECRECANKEYKDGTCKPCNCGVEGSKFQSCKATSGKCDCKAGYKDRDCKTCKDQYFKKAGQDKCLACGCNNVGTTDDGRCGPDGKCTCETVNYKGDKCDQCKISGRNKHEDGVCRECANGKYKNGMACSDCTCDAKGSKFQSCEATSGKCDCNEGYKDKDCNNCLEEFYKKGDECMACGCFKDGTNDGGKCVGASGDCSCKANFNPPKCIGCKDKFYYKSASKTCEACGCDNDGSKNDGKCAEGTGDCTCKPNFKAPKCIGCQDKFYYKTASKSCEACKCDPDGSQNNGKCAGARGACTCNAESNGDKCDGCTDAAKYRPEGGGSCQACNCNTSGTKGGSTSCDRKGQCDCQTGKSGLTCT